jgi:hypothetical protein
MGVLGFMTLIESKCLEASEAHKIGVANLFDRNALLSKRFSADFLHFMVIEDHRRMGNI